MMRAQRTIEAAALVAVALWLAPAAGAQDATALWAKHCNACHGPAGKGDGPAGKLLKPHPADLATVIAGKADADVTKIVTEGGKACGMSPVMPAFGAKLDADQIAGLVAYMKGFAAR